MYIYDIRININSNVKELEYDIIALVSLWHSCASSRLWGSGSTGIASDLVVFEFSSVHDHNRHRGQSACFLTELDTCLQEQQACFPHCPLSCVWVEQKPRRTPSRVSCQQDCSSDHANKCHLHGVWKAERGQNHYWLSGK